MNGTESARLRLTRAMRLQQSREFAAIKARGNRLVRGCLIANWTVLPPGSQAPAKRTRAVGQRPRQANRSSG